MIQASTVYAILDFPLVSLFITLAMVPAILIRLGVDVLRDHWHTNPERFAAFAVVLLAAVTLRDSRVMVSAAVASFPLDRLQRGCRHLLHWITGAAIRDARDTALRQARALRVVSAATQDKETTDGTPKPHNGR